MMEYEARRVNFRIVARKKRKKSDPLCEYQPYATLLGEHKAVFFKEGHNLIVLSERQNPSNPGSHVQGGDGRGEH